jgi:formylglycine-generating enzyme required for sulfatase activity
MPDESPPTPEDLRKVQDAIAAQEALRGILPDEQLDTTLAALRGQLLKLQQAAADRDSAVAQEGGTAVAGRGINVPGSVGGHAVSGDGNVIADHYHAAPTPIDPVPAALTRYLHRLFQRCNALPLAAMGGDESAGRAVLLENVYVEQDTLTRIPRPEAKRAGDREEGRSALDRDEKDAALSALAAATQSGRLVLLGDPGGGKSSFVKQLAAWLAAAMLAKREPPDGWRPLLPLLLNLRDLSPVLAEIDLTALSDDKQQQRLREAVFALWANDLREMNAAELAGDLPRRLDSGEVLLIFDGLDEVPVAGRPRVRQAIKAILDDHGAIERVIVTCRTRSYTGDSVLAGFDAHTLALFDEDKITRFVRGWYEAQTHLGRLSAEEAAAKAGDLSEAATAADLRELSGNPMLLTTMAIIHQQEVGLPKERVRLYDQAVQVLLRRWHKRKGLPVSPELEAVLADDRRLRSILQRLAYEAHRQQSAEDAGDLARGDLLALLESADHLTNITLAAEFLDYVDQRSGLLVGRGGGEDGGQPAVYGFPHRTFQEYLAGCYLVAGRDAKRVLWQRAREGDYWYLAAQLGTEELLFNGTAAGKNTYLDLAYDLCSDRAPHSETEWRALVWSGRMATLLEPGEIARDDMPGGGQAYLDRLVARLQPALTGPLAPVERAEAGRVLARLGDPRPEVMNVDAMPFCLVPAGPFWMGSPDDDPDAGDDEKPLHQIDISYDFWIGRYPVTNAQFQTFVADGGYAQEDVWPEATAAGFWQGGRFKGDFDRDWREEPFDYGEPASLGNHPVVGVSWYEALAFSRWLGDRWHRSGLLPAHLAVVLPSEAEWEKATRGGVHIAAQPVPAMPGDWPAITATVDNPYPYRRYPWGDDWAAGRANHDKSGIESTSAAGVFDDQENVYGAADLSGNVFEWTRSRYKDYEYRPADGREELSTVTARTGIALRGGAHWSESSWLRCACRIGGSPDGRFVDYGFRVVVSPFLPPLVSDPSDL